MAAHFAYPISQFNLLLGVQRPHRMGLLPRLTLGLTLWSQGARLTPARPIQRCNVRSLGN